MGCLIKKFKDKGTSIQFISLDREIKKEPKDIE